LGHPLVAAPPPHNGADVEKIEQSGPNPPNQLQSTDFADPVLASITRELSLWRAFLGAEIDAILRDKD
jgi:hypothetical protein